MVAEKQQKVRDASPWRHHRRGVQVEATSIHIQTVVLLPFLPPASFPPHFSPVEAVKLHSKVNKPAQGPGCLEVKAGIVLDKLAEGPKAPLPRWNQVYLSSFSADLREGEIKATWMDGIFIFVSAYKAEGKADGCLPRTFFSRL